MTGRPPANPVQEASGSREPSEHDDARVLTVPNVLTVARIVGSGVMLWLAYADYATSFNVLFVLLVLTDWLDGKLAIWLDQRTVLGARLDSAADVVMYGVLLVGTAWLRPDFVRAETLLITAMIASYAVSTVIGLIRFRRVPAYHTRAAKTCWFLVAIGAVTLLAGGPAWPARVAMLAVIITNIEAIAISFVLTQCRTDVPSIFHALRRGRTE